MFKSIYHLQRTIRNQFLIMFKKMMTCLCLLYLISVNCVAAKANLNESSIYAGLSVDVAHFFNTICINFLTNTPPEDNFFIGRVLKQVATPSGKLSNVLSFEKYYQNKKAKKLQCHSPLQVIVSTDEASRIAFMRHSHRSSMHGSDSPGGGIWLLILNSVREDFVVEYFNGVNTPYDVQLVIAELKETNEMALKEVYRITPDKPLRVQNLGKWSEEKHLQLLDPLNLHYLKRSNLEGMHLKVGYVLSDPYTFEEYRDGKMVLGGYLGDVWEILENALNISTALSYEPNYGTYSEKTHQWSGIINQVKNGSFDVGIADLTLTKKRNEVISYSNPLVITTFNAFYRSAGSNIETGALFLPLATDLWLSLVGWIIVAALILYFGCYLSDRNLRTYENMTLMNAVFFVAGALCGQGGVNVPKTYTCRIFFIATFFITGVIIPAYSASLMSILTVSTPYVPYSTMKDFYESGKTRMMVKYSSYEYDIFAMESSNDPYMTKIFKRDIEPLPESEFPKSSISAVRKVCENQGLAVFGLADAIKWAVLKEEKREGRKRKCVINGMPMNFGKISLGIAFPKDSHVRGVINHHLSYLPTTGILKRLKNKHWPVTQPLTVSEEHEPVSLNNVVIMFAVIGFGIVTSLIFFVIEIIISKRQQQQLPKKRNNAWPDRVQRHGFYDQRIYLNYRK